MIIVLIITVILLIPVTAFFLSERPAYPIIHLKKAENKVYRFPEDWRGTPVDQKNRFVNYYKPFYQNYLDILKWAPSNFLSLIKNRRWKANVVVQDEGALLISNRIIWLGHASFHLNINGKQILVDPQFYNTSIYRRHSLNPIDPEYFKSIDYLFITHDHADHFDKRSIKKIIHQNGNIHILSGLEMDKLIRGFCGENLNICTGQWFERIFKDECIEVYFIPTQHYCKRIFNRFNSRLWGGFIICYNDGESQRNIFLGGDSGYSQHYSQLKEIFSIDIALLGIGAYKPTWLMHPNHMSPGEAIKAADECNAKVMIPMHFNTFNLSNEHMDEPIKNLLKYKGDRNIRIATIGEPIELNDLFNSPNKT